MSQIMKTFTGMFMILLLGCVSGSMLSALLQVITAQNLQNSIRFRLSASCFAPEVIEECFADAAECGSKLELQLFDEEGRTLTIGELSDIPADTGQVVFGQVRLRFWVEIRIPRKRTSYTLTGYIR